MIVAADVFYDPEVASTFVKCVAVPLLSVGNGMECIIAASERMGTSWQHVLDLFNDHGLCYKVLKTAACPLDSPAPVHVLRLALK